MIASTAPLEREHLSEREAAEFLGKSISTLRRWRWRRVGPPFCQPPCSKGPVYLRRDLTSWIEGARIVPRGDA